MKIIKWLIIILFFQLIFNNCSVNYMQESFTDFNQSTKITGKSTKKCLDELFNEEINTRIAESVRKDSFKQSLLEPKVFTWDQLNLRKELIDYIMTYTSLLEAIVKTDYQKDISKYSKEIQKNLEYIHENHEDWLEEEEVTFISSLLTHMQEALTEGHRFAFLLRIMNQNQPLLELSVKKLITDLNTSLKVINSFFNRQIILNVTMQWPANESKREKFAKLGAKILERKRKINTLYRVAIKTLAEIPKMHKELLERVKDRD